MTSELNRDDQARVDQYLQAPQRRHNRSARSLWWVLLGIWILLFAMGGASYAIARYHGVV